MKKAAWILAIVFGIAFVGATITNAELIGRSREALSRAALGATPEGDSSRYQLVVVIPDTDDSFFRGLLDGISAHAPDIDAAVQVFRYTAATPEDAERYCEIAVRAKVDGLIVYSPRGTDVSERAAKAAQNGVVFIPVGTDPPDGSPRGFIGSGTLRQGIKGGEIIVHSLGSAARVGLILPAEEIGSPTSAPMYTGLKSALSARPGAAIVAVARSRPGILSGEEAAAEILRGNPEINAILCSNAQDTVGAAQVVIDTNKVGTIMIVAADETNEIQRYIDKGVVAASIVRDSKGIGAQAIELFRRTKDGHTIPQSVETGFFIRTKAGIAQ